MHKHLKFFAQITESLENLLIIINQIWRAEIQTWEVTKESPAAAKELLTE